MADEKDLVDGMETLNDSELASVDGGEVVDYFITFYCGHCGAVAEKYTYFPGFSYKCTGCGRLLKSTECKRNTVTYEINGEFHSVSADF